MDRVRRIAPRLLPLVLLGLGGCWDIGKAPEGFGVVREHVIYAPRNVPPITSELDYTILEVDGAVVRREAVPPWVDLQPGALVTAGTHRFTAKVAPHRRPPGYQAQEVTFEATVASGKVYDLVDQDLKPVLVEFHPAP